MYSFLKVLLVLKLLNLSQFYAPDFQNIIDKRNGLNASQQLMLYAVAVRPTHYSLESSCCSPRFSHSCFNIHDKRRKSTQNFVVAQVLGRNAGGRAAGREKTCAIFQTFANEKFVQNGKISGSFRCESTKGQLFSVATS